MKASQTVRSASTRPNRLVLRVAVMVITAAWGMYVMGCGRNEPSAQPSAEGNATGSTVPSANSPAAQPSSGPSLQAPSHPGEMVKIPGGTFHFGSMPGDPGRNPTLEPVEHEVRIGPFEIDKLPYPNRPGAPPKTDVTKEEAARLCEKQGKRLCTEAEWERACKGTNGAMFPTGNSWDPSCGSLSRSCATGFGVLAMGTWVAEWTSGTARLPDGERQWAVTRGAHAPSPPGIHRCARRATVAGDVHQTTIGFRCCRGTPREVPIIPPKAGPIYQEVQVDLEKLQSVFSSSPRLSSLGKIRLFESPRDVKRVLAKGKGETGGNQLTTSPILWSPVPGERILVLAGVGSSGSAFVVAFYSLPNEQYRLASSFIFEKQTDPVVLAYNGWTKRRIRWSTCWECVGEEGAVIYRKGGRVVIEQR